MNKEKVCELMFRAWWWLRVYALYAAIVFVILWALANCGGCMTQVRDDSESVSAAASPPPLSLRLSGMMDEMRQAGCWPMEFSVSFSSPTNYTVSVSGKYYDALDRNRAKAIGETATKGL